MNHYYAKLGLLIAIVGSLYLITSLGQSGFSNLRKKHGAYWWVNEDKNSGMYVDYLCTQECRNRGGIICGRYQAKCCNHERINGLGDQCVKPQGFEDGECKSHALVVNVQYNGRTFYCSE
jgi:hypothetical protein